MTRTRVEPAALALDDDDAVLIPDPKTGKPAFAVMPYANYRELRAAAEEREDRAALAEADAAIAAGAEAVPLAVVERLSAGTAPVRVWREYRGLSQAALAKAAKVPQPTLSALEHGRRGVATATLQRIADALRVELGELARRVAR